jgi:hypothetical protein
MLSKESFNMSTHQKFHDSTPVHKHNRDLVLFTQFQFRAVIALILIALGVVFFLGQSKQLDYSSSWWVIFILIPGAVLLWAAFTTYRQSDRISIVTAVQAFLGVVAILLSAIFILDPHWSFTQNWHLERAFPFLQSINWDRVWPWFLVLPGADLIYTSFRQHLVARGFVGACLVVVGAVFIFNIAWDMVWPLFIIAVGLLLLLNILFPQNKV